MKPAAVLLVLLLAGCAQAQPAPVRETPVTADPATTTSSFYEALRPGPTARLVKQPATLDAAYAEATAVVVAEVTAVTTGRLLGDLQHAVVHLRPSRVLHGALQPELAETRVEFGLGFLPGSIEPLVSRMDAAVPRTPGVWLLRWEGAPAHDPTADPGFYRIVHFNCGVLIDGPDRHVVSAIAQEGDAFGARAEAENYPDLDTLIRRRTPGPSR